MLPQSYRQAISPEFQDMMFTYSKKRPWIVHTINSGLHSLMSEMCRVANNQVLKEVIIKETQLPVKPFQPLLAKYNELLRYSTLE